MKLLSNLGFRIRDLLKAGSYKIKKKHMYNNSLKKDLISEKDGTKPTQ